VGRGVGKSVWSILCGWRGAIGGDSGEKGGGAVGTSWENNVTGQLN